MGINIGKYDSMRQKGPQNVKWIVAYIETALLVIWDWMVRNYLCSRNIKWKIIFVFGAFFLKTFTVIFAKR